MTPVEIKKARRKVQSYGGSSLKTSGVGETVILVPVFTKKEVVTKEIGTVLLLKDYICGTRMTVSKARLLASKETVLTKPTDGSSRLRVVKRRTLTKQTLGITIKRFRRGLEIDLL